MKSEIHSDINNIFKKAAIISYNFLVKAGAAVGAFFNLANFSLISSMGRLTAS